MSRAYEVESKVAVYPRTVIAPALQRELTVDFAQLLIQDEDDLFFISPSSEYFEWWQTERVKELLLSVELALSLHKETPRIFQKYCWLADLLTAIVFSIDYPQTYYRQVNYRQILAQRMSELGEKPDVAPIPIWE